MAVRVWISNIYNIFYHISCLLFTFFTEIYMMPSFVMKNNHPAQHIYYTIGYLLYSKKMQQKKKNAKKKWDTNTPRDLPIFLAHRSSNTNLLFFEIYWETTMCWVSFNCVNYISIDLIIYDDYILVLYSRSRLFTHTHTHFSIIIIIIVFIDSVCKFNRCWHFYSFS